MIINPRIGPRSQRATVRECVMVGGRRVKIVHLELFSIHSNDISLAVSGRGLLMEHLNWPFDNLILLLLIRAHQTVNVTKLMRKIVQIDPEQTPNQNEDWPDVIPSTAFASAIAD